MNKHFEPLLILPMTEATDCEYKCKHLVGYTTATILYHDTIDNIRIIVLRLTFWIVLAVTMWLQ